MAKFKLDYEKCSFFKQPLPNIKAHNTEMIRRKVSYFSIYQCYLIPCFCLKKFYDVQSSNLMQLTLDILNYEFHWIQKSKFKILKPYTMH